MHAPASHAQVVRQLEQQVRALAEEIADRPGLVYRQLRLVCQLLCKNCLAQTLTTGVLRSVTDDIGKLQLVCACVRACACVYIYMCVCMYVCGVCVCIYVYMYIMYVC